VKVGDLVRFRDSSRRNGKLAGQYGLIVGMDAYNHPVVNVAGTVKAYHRTQVERVINESR
jgi:hypothetical protein